MGAGIDSWHRIIEQTRIDEVDQKLISNFRTECTNRNLIVGLAELCRLFHRRRSHYPQEMTGPRKTTARLRSRLAHVCVDALQPDLIILDEFQRFTELLHGEHDAAMLARDLFDYTDREGNAARTLLLSATPYRMLTLSGDTEDDGNHHREFLETLRFLYGQERGPDVAEDLGREVDRFRRAMLSLPHSKETAREHKLSIEDRLRAVIARTERVASTRDRDSMVEEPNLAVGVAPEDLRSAAAVAGVARVAGAPEVVEYWKSAPYLLTFMRDYALKRAIKAYDGKDCPAPLLDAIKAARRSSLTRRRIREYRPLKPPNGRMRLLMDDVFGDGLDQHLWIPPSLPYYGDGDSDANRTSKSLVFSSWSVVPDAVAAILSYDDEAAEIQRAVITFINEAELLPHGARIANVSAERVEIVDGHGSRVAVEEMSDGYRSILSLTFELMRLLFWAFGIDTALKGIDTDAGTIALPGVVAIDEIDAHLHPAWQQRIGEWFVARFPQMQFLVTTHSPIICRAARHGSVWVLPAPDSEAEPRRVVGTELDRLVDGNVPDAYSTELFGEEVTRSEQSKKKLERLARLNRKRLKRPEDASR